MNDIEQFYNDLQEINNKLENLDKEIESLDEEIEIGQEKYPDIKISEIRKLGLDANEYITKQEEIEAKIQLRNEKIEEETNLLAQKTEIEEKKKVAEEAKKQEKIQNIEAIRVRKEEKQKKQEDMNKKISDFKNDFDKLFSQNGIIKGKDMDKLMALRDELNNTNFLAEQERKEYIDKINDKLTENNEKINNPEIEVKEPKVMNPKILAIKNKARCIIAKGKKTTIDYMKSVYDKSIGKVVKGVKGIFDKLKSKKKDIAILVGLMQSKIKEIKTEYEKLNMQNENEQELDDDEIMNMMADAQNMAREEEQQIINTPSEPTVSNVEPIVSVASPMISTDESKLNEPETVNVQNKASEEENKDSQIVNVEQKNENIMDNSSEITRLNREVNRLNKYIKSVENMKEGTTASRNETIEHYKAEKSKIVEQLKMLKQQLNQSETMAQMTGNMFVQGTENEEENKSSMSM